jgi:hypothetical protein
MHSTDLAPVLSATSNRVSVWIISLFPTCIPHSAAKATKQESVLDPSSTPQTTRSTSDWADTYAFCKAKPTILSEKNRGVNNFHKEFWIEPHLSDSLRLERALLH